MHEADQDPRHSSNTKFIDVPRPNQNGHHRRYALILWKMKQQQKYLFLTISFAGLLIPEELHMDMVYQKSKLLQAILPIGYAICLKNAECRDDESPATVQLPKALMDELTANWLEPIGNAIAEKAHQSPES